MQNELKAIITADTSNLEANLKKADKELERYAKKIDDVSTGLKKSVADTQRLVKEISDLKNEFKNGSISQTEFNNRLTSLTNQLRKADANTSAYQKELKRLKTEYDRISRSSNSFEKSVKNTSKPINRMGGQIKNVTPTMMSFSQVIQDAPYGINGVANNIQQLTAQFGYLQKNAGGTRNALKALVGSLSGPAGVLLAVSAVTSILVTYGDEILGLIQKTDNLSDATNKYSGEANTEISRLNNLVSIARDEKNSKKVRTKAINELNKKYPKYLNNLSVENINTKNVTRSINSLTNALINEAKVRGVREQIEEINNERAEKSIKLYKSEQNAVESLAKRLRFLQARGDIDLDIGSEGILELLEGKGYERSSFIEALKQAEKQILRTDSASRELNSGISGVFAQLASTYESASNNLEDFDNETNNLLRDLIKLEKGLTIDIFEAETPDLEPTKKSYEVTYSDILKLAKDSADERLKTERDFVDGVIKKMRELTIFAEDISLALNIDFKGFEDWQQDLDPFSGLKESVDNGEREIQRLEKAQERLAKVMDKFFGEDISEQMRPQIEQTFGDNASLYDNYAKSLTNAMEYSKVAAGAIVDSMSVWTDSLVESLGITDKVTQRLVGNLIGYGERLLQEQIQQMLKGLFAKKANATKEIIIDQTVATGNAVAAGSETAASSGPAAAFLLPALVGAAVGFIASMFSGLKFASGGIVPGGSFNGDKVPAMINSGEMILNYAQQSELFKALSLRTASRGINNGVNQIEVFGRIKGQDIELASSRYNRGRGRIN